MSNIFPFHSEPLPQDLSPAERNVWLDAVQRCGEFTRDQWPAATEYCRLVVLTRELSAELRGFTIDSDLDRFDKLFRIHATAVERMDGLAEKLRLNEPRGMPPLGLLWRNVG